MADGFADLINNLNNKLSGFQSQLEGAKGDQEKLLKLTQEMFQVLNDEVEEFAKKSAQATSTLGQGLEKDSEGAKKTAASVKGVTQALDQMGTQGKADTEKVRDGTENINKSLRETEAQTKKAADGFAKMAGNVMDFTGALSRGNIGGALGVINPVLGRIAGAMQEVYDRSRVLNKEVLEFAGATMPMGKAAGSADMYRNKINSLAMSMGLTLEEAHAYAKTMQETGFSLEQVTGKVDVAGKSMTTMKAVQAAGISIGATFAETNQLMAESQLYLGQTAAKAVEGIINIGVAARNAGVSAKILMPIVKNLQGEFRYLGMDTVATTNLITKMGGSSKTAAADVGLMGKALGGMLQMQAGSKAFFALTGGLPGVKGAGAVGGALAFEAALAGKGGGTPQQAMTAISQSLKQMTGGGIVSQTQAYDKRTSETIKTQFYMQRDLISKQMGLSTQEAGRMLELMSKTEKGTASKKEQEKLQKTMQDVGKDQAYYVRETYKSSDRIATLIGTQTQRLAGILDNIFGSVKNIARAVVIAGGVGIVGKFLTGGGKGIIEKIAGAAGRGAGGAAEETISLSNFMKGLPGGAGGIGGGGGLLKSLVGGTLGKVGGVATLITGGVMGAMGAKEAGMSTGAGTAFGVLTGGAGTGSALSGTLGLKKGGGADLALGVLGAGARGAAVGTMFGGPIGAAIGAAVGMSAEGIKIYMKTQKQKDKEELQGLKEKISLNKQLSKDEAQRYAELTADEKARQKQMSEIEKQDLAYLNSKKGALTKEEQQYKKTLEAKKKGGRKSYRSCGQRSKYTNYERVSKSISYRRSN